jgi:hypothetical protein
MCVRSSECAQSRPSESRERQFLRPIEALININYPIYARPRPSKLQTGTRHSSLMQRLCMIVSFLATKIFSTTVGGVT